MDAFLLTPSEIPHAWTMVKFLTVIVLLGVMAAVLER